MGMGTVTVRFMMDDLRADNRGIPNATDVQVVNDYIDSVRPVAVKDTFVFAPVPFYYTITIRNLVNDTPDVRARILASIQEMEIERSNPGQTMYRSWVDEAISEAVGEENHDTALS